MNNVATYVALEKVAKAVNRGRIVLELQVFNGDIAGVTATGKKKLTYKVFESDEDTNKGALSQLVKRVVQQLESGVSGELVFTVRSTKTLIKSIEVESKQTIK